MPKRIIVALAVFLAPTVLHAQDRFDHGVPMAFPGRPTISNPAYIPAAGYLQFEQGVQITAGAPSVDTQIGVNQSTKLALNRRVLINTQWQPTARSTSQGQDAAYNQGDLSAGIQVLLTTNAPENSYRPVLALGLQRRLHAGTAPDFDAAGNLTSAIVYASGKLPGDLDYDANFLFNQQTDGSTSQLQTGEAIALSHDLTNKLSLSGEIWHFTQPYDHNNSVGSLWALNYRQRPNLVFDAGVSRGLTQNSAHWYGFFGFTYLLPHALWHRNGYTHPR